MKEKEDERVRGAEQRQVNPPNPSPAHVLAEKSTDGWAQDASRSSRYSHDAQVDGTILQRGHVGDNDLTQDIQAATAKALECSARDDARHAVGEREHKRARGEEDKSRLQQGLAAVDVGEARVERLRNDNDQQERDAGPEGLQGCAMELVGNGLVEQGGAQC